MLCVPLLVGVPHYHMYICSMRLLRVRAVACHCLCCNLLLIVPDLININLQAPV